MLQPHVLYVSTKQRGNGVLQHIRNVPYAFTKMVPDFIMSTTQCALFLSVKYHQLYPNYIHRRLGELKSDFMLRILLVLVDVEDNVNALRFLNKLAVTHNLTLMLSWTEAEAARYLETYKALDGTDATSIQRREQNNFVDQVSEFLTASNPCNKTDSGQLLSHFRTVQSVVAASQDELATCPGLGAVKVRKLWDAFHQPFSSKQAAARQKKASDAVGGGTNRNGDSTTNANP
uniref:ERCC1-like central domain-containing protein n=1 Tax=Craspedostauros australis TaxID=1486917 RepID=A0A7R9WTG4_9STRA